MYDVNINSRAERELKRLDRQIKNRIVTASTSETILVLPGVSK